MKTITLSIAVLLSSLVFAQEMNNNISLSGSELIKYQKKQSTSIIVSLVSAGLVVIGSTQEDAQPMMYVGGMGLFGGLVINISSLSNLKRSGKYLKEVKR